MLKIPTKVRERPSKQEHRLSWEGQETSVRLQGWSRSRRVILLRRLLPATSDKLVMVPNADGQPDLFFADAKAGAKVWEFAALVTSLDLEILSLGQLYRDRGDSENPFDELKDQWGWAGFTTSDINRGSSHRAHRAGLQPVDAVRPFGRSQSSSRGRPAPCC